MIDVTKNTDESKPTGYERGNLLRDKTISELRELFRNQYIRLFEVPREYWEEHKRERGFGKRRP